MSNKQEMSAYERLEDRKQTVRSLVQEYIEHDDVQHPSDVAFEIADGAVPIYNSDVMELASIPEVYSVDVPACYIAEDDDLVKIAMKHIFKVLEDEAYSELQKQGVT